VSSGVLRVKKREFVVNTDRNGDDALEKASPGDLVVVEGRRMFQLRVARLADAHRLQKSKTRDFRLEAAALVAEDEAAVSAVVAALVDGESGGREG
jgi:hypothetical protein